MKLTPHITPIIILAFLAAIGSACNEKSKEAEDVTDYSNTSVTSFYIKANNKVMENLDSVFFSIDLERGLIFNADSLPKGTDVSRLIPMVTCASGVREVVFDMEGGSYRTGQSNYTLHPADTIDFSGRVTLKVTAADGTNSRLYEVKVNVHRTNPDSLAWGKVALSRLPARLPEPRAQKCVDFGGKPLMLLAEADGSFTLARADAPDGSWSREEVAPGFSPDVRSLTATTDALYILDTDGRLMTSADGRVWTFTGRKWVSLTGAYVDHALGLCAGDNGLEHDPLIELPRQIFHRKHRSAV